MHRRAWFLVFVIGFVVVFATNLLYSNNPNQGWLWGASIILVVLMLFYGWAVNSNPDSSIDIKADGIYYLGLLFTFTSLVATLVFSQILNPSDGGLSEQLFANFGIALITTIIGLAGRVWFTMMQNSPGDVGASALQSLSEVADNMKTQIVMAGQKMEDLVWHLNHSVEAFQKAYKEIRTLPESVINTNDRLQAATNRFAETMDNLYTPLTDADQMLSQMNALYGKLGKTILQTQTQLSSFNTDGITGGISQLQEQIVDASQHLERFQLSLERSCNSVSDFGDKIQQRSLTLDGIDASGKQFVELGDKLTAFENSLQSLQFTFTQIVQSSETVSGSITRSHEVIQHASDVVDQASAPFQQLETTIINLPNDITHLHNEVTQLSDSLATAKKKSDDLQIKLNIAHNSVPSPHASQSQNWIKRFMHRWSRSED